MPDKRQPAWAVAVAALVFILTGCDENIPQDVRMCASAISQVELSFRTEVVVNQILRSEVPAAAGGLPVHSEIVLTYTLSPARADRPGERQARCKITVVKGAADRDVPIFLFVHPDTQRPLTSEGQGPLRSDMLLAGTVPVTTNVWWNSPGYKKAPAITNFGPVPTGW